MSEPTSGHDAPSVVHLAPPSVWPLVMAIGIAAALAGIVMHPLVWIIGLIIVAVALGGWFTELGRDIRNAPDSPEG